MKKSHKILIFALCAVALLSLAACQSSTSNDAAQRDKESRYLTIINDTNQVINKVHVIVGEGTEIEAMEQTNPDDKSFSVKIPDAYSEFTTFTVILTDRYDLNYAKEVTNVPAAGRTEVIVSDSDYVPEKGDWRDKIDKWINGD